MAGSRKGERRGGARLGGGIKKGPHERKFDKRTGKIKPKAKPGRPPGESMLTKERRREMMEIITGHKDVMPNEVLLECMRTLLNEKHTIEAMIRIESMRVPVNEKDRQEQDTRIAGLLREQVQMTMLTAQVARDAAPYNHARLAAVAMVQNPNASGDLFDKLLAEINETPRFKAIEHRTDEVPGAVIDNDDDEEQAA